MNPSMVLIGTENRLRCRSGDIVQQIPRGKYMEFFEEEETAIFIDEYMASGRVYSFPFVTLLTIHENGYQVIFQTCLAAWDYEDWYWKRKDFKGRESVAEMFGKVIENTFA